MENEPRVKNMGLIPESTLEKRALLFETQKTIQNIKKFIKDVFGVQSRKCGFTTLSCSQR